MKLYTLTPGAGPPPGADKPQLIVGFREAIATARELAERHHCSVQVRNEADCHTWQVAFRVRGNRSGPRCVVEVTR